MQTNLPALQTTNLPAHLAAAIAGKQLTVSANALVATSSGGAIRIVANQGRWRVKDGSTETVLPDLFLDAIFVGALPGVTKAFYIKAYVPGADNNDGPDCASLLGDVPDAESPHKQAATCAECAQNAWGSKVTPAGVEIKACSDYRRTAIIAADDPDVVYQANIPPASIKDWVKYIKELSQRGVDVSMVVTRLTLDDHKWVFAFNGFANAEQYAAVQELAGSPAVEDVLGTLGRKAAPAALPAPAQQAAAPAPAPTPAAAPAPAPEPATPAKGFGKKKGAAAAAAVTQPAQAAATVVVAGASSGLDSLAAELGNLINGAADV